MDAQVTNDAGAGGIDNSETLNVLVMLCYDPSILTRQVVYLNNHAEWTDVLRLKTP